MFVSAVIMKFLFALFVAILQFQPRQCSFDAAIPSVSSEIVVSAVYRCEGDESTSYYDIDLKDDGNEKWVEGTMQTDIPIDSTIQLKIQVDQWINGAWQETYNTDGNLWDMIDKYASTAWKRMAASAEPKLDPETYIIPPGTYTGKKVQVKNEDMYVPSILFGAFKVKWEGFTEDDKLVFCIIVEGHCDRT